jgi:hypothetical protein
MLAYSVDLLRTAGHVDLSNVYPVLAYLDVEHKFLKTAISCNRSWVTEWLIAERGHGCFD